MAELPDELPNEQNVFVLIVRWRVTRGLLIILAIALSFFYVRTYVRVYDPVFGWTKLIHFGALFDARILPRLRQKTHYIHQPASNEGADGEFYAQMAFDPSLRDPGFERALDNPIYRGRRIGLPALAYVIGLSKPRYILQVYAVANLFFWFVLMGTLFRLLQPRTGRHLLCLSAALLSYGVIASMQFSMTDLPAAALIMVGILIGSWGGYAALAAAALTRETSALAVLGCLDPRRPWRDGAWKRQLGLLAVGLIPLVLWVAYVLRRFGHANEIAATNNFSWPLWAMFLSLGRDIARCSELGLSESARHAGLFGWLYLDNPVSQVFTILGLFFQSLYLFLRREYSSAIWRTGFLYGLLCLALGTAVWSEAANAVRALIPLTICFYLRLAQERGQWFWPFFVLGSLVLPFGLHMFWTLQ